MERGRTVMYARVSSADQKGNLDKQVARVPTWAAEHGYSVDQVVTEVGPALNGIGASSSRSCGVRQPAQYCWSTGTGSVVSGQSRLA